ncbi:MAG: cation:proton antiporter [Thermoanaerobaculia bacterium]|nr:cation:proton antiporter [Thermoanaerobaculia bacterium]
MIQDFLLALMAIFAAAKLMGALAVRFRQPAVLGELIGGVVIGVSGLRWVDPHNETIHLLSELGVILLLFLIGLETNLGRLLSVGRAALSVAVVGVALPMIGGYGVGTLLGYSSTVALFLGAALTATSVGITARVLSDLGHLRDPDSQVILGAAVADDVIGLVILTVVSAIAAGTTLSVWGVSRITLVAFGFVIVAVVVGSKLAEHLVALIARLRVVKALFFGSIMFAFGLALLAELAGSALIVGAFAAGVVLARTKRGEEIEHEVHDIAQFFIPIFFVSVGAAVDLRTLSPIDPASRKYLLIGVALTLVAIVGKVLAGYAAGRGHRRLLIGVGMIPRGEVGLIFAQIGLSSGLLTAGLYSSVAMMVIVSTFIAPPLLRLMLPPVGGVAPGDKAVVLGEYAMDAPSDRPDGEDPGT